MRFLRAAIIGFLSIFPGTIVGYIGWLATGGSKETYAPEVVFFCNIIPFGFVFLGFIWAWRNGEEYGVKIYEKKPDRDITYNKNITYNTVTNITDSAIVADNLVNIANDDVES